MIMWFCSHKCQRVNIVACEGLQFADFIEDVLGHILAARIEDVFFVAEDVVEGSAGGVVSQLSSVFTLHGRIIILELSSGININVVTANDQKWV